MHIPKPKSLRESIALHIHSAGPQSMVQLIDAVKTVTEKSIKLAVWDMASDGVLQRDDKLYDLAPSIRTHYNQCEVRPAYIGEVTKPADPALNCKPWSGKYSIANAPRREPIREVSFLNGGIGFGYGYQA